MPPHKPPLRIQPTTLWDYPSQNYAAPGMSRRQGDIHYAGATPSYVIWNLLERYTREGDLMIDPFCGSGTSLDVAADLKRKARGFDVSPYRDDIEPADARELPMPDEVVDFVFMDPPYSDNLKYSDDERCIGRINATDEAYFEALEDAFDEAWRVMKDRRYMAVYICDYYGKPPGSRRAEFVPIGMRCMALLALKFRLIEHICVVRHNRALKDGRRRRQAEEGNFFLRGFNHLMVVKKEIDHSE